MSIPDAAIEDFGEDLNSLVWHALEYIVTKSVVSWGLVVGGVLDRLLNLLEGDRSRLRYCTNAEFIKSKLYLIQEVVVGGEIVVLCKLDN